MPSTSVPLKVTVMGAGAVGCYFGGMLARAGHDVTLVARPAHVEAISRDGLRLETKTFDEHVRLRGVTDPAAAAGADLVLFCVKSMDTEAAGRQLQPFLRPVQMLAPAVKTHPRARKRKSLLVSAPTGKMSTMLPA